jgi:hypothetical protein
MGKIPPESQPPAMEILARSRIRYLEQRDRDLDHDTSPGGADSLKGRLSMPGNVAGAAKL